MFYKFYRAIEEIYLSWHYNVVNSYIFVNNVKICKLKAKDSEINAAPLCLDYVSKAFLVANMKDNMIVLMLMIF